MSGEIDQLVDALVLAVDLPGRRTIPDAKATLLAAVAALRAENERLRAERDADNAAWKETATSFKTERDAASSALAALRQRVEATAKAWAIEGNEGSGHAEYEDACHDHARALRTVLEGR